MLLPPFEAITPRARLMIELAPQCILTNHFLDVTTEALPHSLALP